MKRDPPFREARRDPTDRRSWRQTPVFVGDAAIKIDEPSCRVMVTGVRPRNRVEVVSEFRAERALDTFRDLADVEAAIRDGRLLPRSLRRTKLAPLTSPMVDKLADETEAEA